MRKFFALALTLALCGGYATAQTDDSELSVIKQARHEMFKRDASKKHLNSPFKLAPATATNGAKSAGLQLPDSAWFPGEWEEVKAIVVTCGYDYYPAGHEGDMYWVAEPMLTGYATWYHYDGGWQEAGSGSYVAVPDTSNSSYSNLFFYVMDAIQQGGAEAWVRIEQASDSALIKRKLQRMNLHTDRLKWIVGPGNAFWFRDCGPICFYYGAQDSVAMVDFAYYPGRALDDSLPSLIEDQFGIPNYITTIEWEGGNCLVDGAGMLVTSDAVYDGNSDTYGQLTWDGSDVNTINYSHKQPLSEAQVKDSLAHILGNRATYILPAFKYDGGTGHVDLYADMWDENEFVFSIMPDNYSNWVDYKTGQKNMDSLTSYMSVFDKPYKSHGLPFPSTNNGGNFSSQNAYNSNYTRSYSNHTFVNNLIIQPVFSTVVDGMPSAAWDSANFEVIRKAYPGYTIYPIDVRSFDGWGGAIHCITKQIPADNPIRILHASVTGDANATAQAAAEIPISAIVTNRSGIESVTLYWRVDGGAWNTAAMTATGNANEYAAAIPTASITPAAGSYCTIEYYISAVSNNGKTITKPMTAQQGGYYTCYLGENMPLAIADDATVTMSQFFPNPASDKASIRMDLAKGTKLNVQIIDMTGRIVHNTTLEADGSILYSIDTQRLGKGVYSVVFTDNEGLRTTRRLLVR